MTCANNAWGECMGEILPAPETCNGEDDDCDGETDEGIGNTTCGEGACRRTVETCQNGTPISCVPGDPVAEACDGLDNDCDGETDEELGMTSCGVGACFACVVKMKADTPDGWEYVRTCKHGPVFRASQVYWE